MSDEIDVLKSLIEDIKDNRIKLPTLPQVAMKVSDAMRDNNASAKSIAKVISTDAALTAKLIQVSNSAFSRGNSKIDNVQMAISRLGMKIVKNLVTSLLIKQLFHTKFPLLKKQMERLWVHSTKVGAISFIICKKFSRLTPDEAMLAGLVHDIGELPIIAHVEKFPDIASDPAKLENIISKLRPSIGKMMLETWNFSPELIPVPSECEILDRNPSDTPDYTDIVMLANLHSYMGTQHPLGKVNWAEIPALEKLGMDPQSSIETLQEAREEILEIQKLIS